MGQQNSHPEQLVTSAEPTNVEDRGGYRLLTYEDVEVNISIPRRAHDKDAPEVWVESDRLDTKVEVVTDINYLGFELWRYTYAEGEKPNNAGAGSHRGTYTVEIEENHYNEGEVHEFSIRVQE